MTAKISQFNDIHLVFICNEISKVNENKNEKNLKGNKHKYKSYDKKIQLRNESKQVKNMEIPVLINEPNILLVTLLFLLFVFFIAVTCGNILAHIT